MSSMLTDPITTSQFILKLPLIIFKFYVRPDLVQSYGTVTYILLPGFILSLKMAFYNAETCY